MKVNRSLLYLGALLLLSLAFFQIKGGLDQPNPSATSGKPTGAPFTLTSHQGEVSLSDFEGQLALIYFGYTWCPDICPTSMLFLAKAVNSLPDDLCDQLQPIFISVDPKRDSPERLADYVDFFEAGILGLTGEEDYLAKLAKQYGAFYRYVEIDSAMGYAVDHTSDFYLVNSSGKLLATLPHSISGEELQAVLIQALENQL
ncbi:SCO family protein [Marinospirillum insulare]|uniref:Thioredoxin domain-containing protein n=1 Tax=Marinospirillum insulare TaxID=217169 RepID=A0ABQ5ZXZ9_9GAMM|nr:SCO family protein [Marinospirillum insulare]GLR64307.1 hypothetical protein GCM10007878_17450 [Marinospirillum insulare]